MKAEHHIVIMLVIAIACYINAVPVAGLLLFLGIPQAILYCVGYIDPPIQQEEHANELG